MEHNNQNFKFKTNINCGGCLAAVKPYLDQAAGIVAWKVDIASADKLLTVTSNGATCQQVIEMVEKAGFRLEAVPKED